MPDLLETFARGMVTDDFRDGRIPYLLYGVVTDVEAPTSSPWLGRIKARVGAQGDRETTHWLDPAWQGGLESIPRVGDPVFVQFVDGDPNRGVYSWHPTTRTKNRAQDFMLLGTTFAAMYNDLATKLNNLLSHYQAFYGFVQGHVHASFGTASASLLPITIDATAKDTSTSTGLIQASDKSIVSSSSSNAVALSGITKVQK